MTITGSKTPAATIGQVLGQQHHPGDAEDDARHGKNIDEPSPGRAGVATLVQVVQVGNRAALGKLVHHFARLAVDAQPCIAAGPRQAQVDLEFRPLRGLPRHRNAQLPAQPLRHLVRQGHLLVGLALLRREAGAQIVRQDQFPFRHLRLRPDLARMVERDPGDREEQHRRQTDRAADPMPQVELLRPKRLPLLRCGRGLGKGLWCFGDLHGTESKNSGTGSACATLPVPSFATE